MSTKSEEEINAELVNELLPDWAVSTADPDTIEIMQNLTTKDGKRTGNATIADIRLKRYKNQRYHTTLVSVITDAGSHMLLTVGELFELFEPGNFILKRFPFEDAARQYLEVEDGIFSKCKPNAVTQSLRKSFRD